MGWTSLLLSLLAVGQAPIDYETPGQSLGAAMTAISKPLDKPWRVSPQIADEIVILRIKGRTPEDTRKWIADATQTRWTEGKDSWLLDRPESLWKANAKKVYEWKLKAIKEAQAKFREQAKKLAGMTETEEQGLIEEIRAATLDLDAPQGRRTAIETLIKVQMRVPIARVGMEVAAATSADELAKLSPGESTHFGLRPNWLHRPFGRGALDAVTEAMNRQRTFSATMRSLVESKNPAAGYFYQLVASVPADRMGAITIETTCDSLFEQIYVTTTIRSDDGSTVYLPVPIDLLVEDKPQLELSEDPTPASKLSNLHSRATRSPVEVYADPWIRERLLNPDKFDPIASVFGESLLAGLNRASAEVAIHVDDAVLRRALTATQGESSATAILNALSSGGILRFKQDRASITGQVFDLARSRLFFTPRRALKDFLRAEDALGAGLRDWIPMVGAMESPGINNLAFLIYCQFFPELDFKLFNENWEALKILSYLSSYHLDSLLEGQTLSLGAADSRARKHAQKLIQNKVITIAKREDLRDVDGELHFNFVAGKSEPTLTDLLSNSSLDSAQLKMTEGSCVGAFCFESTGYSYFVSSDVLRKPGTASNQFREFQAGDKKTYSFRIEMPNGATLYWSNPYRRRRPGSTPGPFENLPSDIREAVERAEARRKSNPPPFSVR